LQSHIKAIHTIEGELTEAFAPLSVSLTLEDEIDISRGDLLAKSDDLPHVKNEFAAMICWFGEKKLIPRGKYYLRHTTRETQALVMAIDFKVNIETLERDTEDAEFHFNDIGQIRLRVAQPLAFDEYGRNRQTGSFILVDAGTNETVAAGMIVG
jgi:sulfate adenylyltransferase subunit 1 (EFTu-like GTPase family)